MEPIDYVLIGLVVVILVAFTAIRFKTKGGKVPSATTGTGAEGASGGRAARALPAAPGTRGNSAQQSGANRLERLVQPPRPGHLPQGAAPSFRPQPPPPLGPHPAPAFTPPPAPMAQPSQPVLPVQQAQPASPVQQIQSGIPVQHAQPVQGVLPGQPVQLPQPVGATTLLARPTMAVLEAVAGRDRGQRFALLLGDNRLGRAPGNQIPLADETISNQHAILRVNPGEILLFDDSSTNGSFLNGQQVLEPRRVQEGDRLTFGQTTLVLHPLTRPANQS